ncbi:MAG: flagellar hook-associated protein FlgK [Phycisphaerales bacterium]|nr:flagellar hook-associated protein FlgK [Phycisphaerales bacterium]
MGLLTSSLETGRNALISYQSALQIVGNNVTNSGNADYTRQSAQLSAVMGTTLGPGLQPGAGVTLSGIKRHVDEGIENRLRAATGDLHSAAAESQAVARVEAFFDDLSGAGISSSMTGFFNSLSDVQNAPDDLAIRAVAVSLGESLAGSLQGARGDLFELGLDLNEQIRTAAQDGDRLATEIADLNSEISALEAGSRGQANALRDRRDAALRELSETFDVLVREQPNGSINVYIGSEPLVQGGSSRGLTTEDEVDGEFIRTNVRFADTDTRVNIAGGIVEGLVLARDEHAYARMGDLDELAQAIITEVNSLHADGQGLTRLRSVVSTEAVADTSAALNGVDAGLRNPPVDGSFYITVADDATGTPVAYRIDIDLDGANDDDTSLEDLVAAINAQVGGVTASITPDQRLSLEADAGFSFSFGHDGQQFRADSSKTLAGLGINTFFTGSGAADIAVREDLRNDSGLLAAATQDRTGDGINAGRMAGALSAAADSLDGTSLLQGYNEIANRVASAGNAAKNKLEAADAVTASLSAQRESVSGVSLDEEAIDLLRFERAFQGAARFVSTVDDMMQEMLALAS